MLNSTNPTNKANYTRQSSGMKPFAVRGGGFGSLDTYCEVSVPPQISDEINKEINQLQKFINDRVNLVNVHKGIDAFQFNPSKAKKSLKKSFSISSPLKPTEYNEDDKAELARRIRAERYQLLKVSKAILVDNKRRYHCQQTAYDGEKGITTYYHQGSKKASFGGYQSCGSPTCPHCGNKIALANEAEIAKAIAVCKEKGYDYSLFTNTIRHKKFHTLLELLDFYSKVFEVFRNSKQYRKLKNLGYLGDIKALETPHADANGWHPHFHTFLIFNRLLTADERQFVEKKLISAWLTACSTVIERDQLNPHDLMPEPEFVDVTFNKQQIDDTLSEYLTKQGADTKFIQFNDDSEIRIRSKEFAENPKWGAGKELTRGNMKRSKGDSVTPNDMLRIIAENVDNPDPSIFNKYAYLYREFVEAMKGRSMLRWTPKLRQRLFGDDYEEQSDQEKADDIAENSEPVMNLSIEEERAIRKLNSEAYFLRLVEINHDVGGINIKEILKNLVGLYRQKFNDTGFDFDKLDRFVKGNLVQDPILKRAVAPCEMQKMNCFGAELWGNNA